MGGQGAGYAIVLFLLYVNIPGMLSSSRLAFQPLMIPEKEREREIEKERERDRERDREKGIEKRER